MVDGGRLNNRGRSGIFRRAQTFHSSRDCTDMATSSDKVNNNAQGWGAAAATVLLALVCAGGAYAIHLKTYRSPTDVLAPVQQDATH